MPADVLSNALDYALNQLQVQKTHICVLNASGSEQKDWDRQSFRADISVNNTLKSDYNTVLVRATRQTDETLGLIAHAYAHLAPDGSILIAQENRHGASSLEKAVRGGFTDVSSISKFKCRILQARGGNLAVLKGWAERAEMQKIMDDQFWSVPGLFSWNRADMGSALLLKYLPDILTGTGADLGCGYGYLSCGLKTRRGMAKLYAVDLDSRAVECTRRNLAEMAPSFEYECLWRDVTMMSDLKNLDWVIMNPPFHTQLDEDRELGQKFCEAALKMLKSGGNLYIVANRHMPYEPVLKETARSVHVLADTGGFKILHAVR